jgi:hypothetical protein
MMEAETVSEMFGHISGFKCVIAGEDFSARYITVYQWPEIMCGLFQRQQTAAM